MNYCIFKPNINECCKNGREYPTWLVVDAGTLAEEIKEQDNGDLPMSLLFKISETEEGTLKEALKWIKQYG